MGTMNYAQGFEGKARRERIGDESTLMNRKFAFKCAFHQSNYCRAGFRHEVQYGVSSVISFGCSPTPNPSFVSLPDCECARVKQRAPQLL